MAVKVTDILQQILTDQARRTIDGQETLQRMLEEVRRQVLQELVSVPASDTGFPAWRLRQTLDSVNHHLAGFESEARKEMAVTITESWEAGAGMLEKMVVAGGGNFGISSNLLTQMDPWLQNMKKYAWDKIEGLAADGVAKIKAELSLGVLGQKTPYEVAQAVAGNLAGTKLPTFKNSETTIFKTIGDRAQVITQTEMGRAFSMAHQGSLAAAADTLPGLKKMWLHAGHPRVARIFHKNLHGSVKPVAENWLVGSIAMMYPRDPKAPASEVIRCGCMHTGYMEEWGTQDQIKDAWKDAQDAANKPKGEYKQKED